MKVLDHRTSLRRISIRTGGDWRRSGWTCPLLVLLGAILLCSKPSRAYVASSPPVALLSAQPNHIFTSSRPSTNLYVTVAATPKDSTPRKGQTSGNHKSAKRKPRKHRQTKRQRIRKMYQKAKTLERKGQWRKAAALLQDILQQAPTDAHSHLALARLEARRASPNATIAFENGTRNCPTSVHLWQAWAVYEETQHRMEEARDKFDRALGLEPTNPYVCHAYGLMERKLGNDDKSYRLWDQALQETSTAALVCQMAELLIARKEFKKAKQLYAKHLPKLSSDREKTEVYLASAWLEERYLGDYDRAETLIRQAMNLYPTSSLPQVALARLAGRRQGQTVRTATVRRLANACLHDDVTLEDGRVYNAWANCEAKARRFKSARKILQKGISQYPRDHALWQAAGKMEERLGNVTGARDLYSASLRIQPSAPTLVSFAQLELRKPQVGRTANLTQVERLFQEALLLDPRHGPAYNSYGNVAFRILGNVTKAREIYRRGINAKCSDAASVYHGFARMELALGHVDRARKLLQQGQRRARMYEIGNDSPHRDRAMFLTHTLGMLELNSNHAADGLAVFEDGIERYGNSSQLLLGAALCEMKLGAEQKARRYFERSVMADERHAHAWQAWGVMEAKAGNWKTAKTLFDSGIRSVPQHGALWLAYAIGEGRMGNLEESRLLFARGLRHAPRHFPLYQAWASLELRNSNYTSAKTLISECLTLDKSNGPAWLVAAETERQLGSSGLVNLILRRGIECAPTYPQLYRALGDSLCSEGRINEAREVYKKGIDVDPMHAPLYHSLAELEARIFNIAALSELNRKASKVFQADALATSGDKAWSDRIRVNRQRSLPRDVAALAQRIVEEDSVIDEERKSVNPDTVLEDLSVNMEDGLVGQMLAMDEEG